MRLPCYNLQQKTMKDNNREYYKESLAHIHNSGYLEHAQRSAPGILKILSENNIQDGLIVDLGCGSGCSALEFIKAGYNVLGIDISESMIALARMQVPTANFQVISLFKAEIPPCQAVTSIGECLNYLFDTDNDDSTLTQLFERIYNALVPGGLLIFDILEVGQIPPGVILKNFQEGKDWIVLVELEEDEKQSTLTRRIISLRKFGDDYRRDDEIHQVRLYKAEDLREKLSAVGFQVEILNAYAEFKLREKHAVFVARKIP